MSEELLAPPVVAVVVSCDPGPWLEECLASLRDQDYGNVSLLVIDAGSAEPLAARVAAVTPDAFIFRQEEHLGYGPAANAVIDLVDGSTHYLFCHDDVVLAPDALQRMVEEAFRSNAGVVAPKLVDYSEPDLLLQLGLGVDRFGAPVRRVERREFDQSQHDEVREVFAAPGGCTLFRSDLFAAVGGFDPKISMFGEDVDLCWRARLAGARVVVVPLATVRHLEATAARHRTLRDARSLQWRHELRAVLKNYGRVRLAIVSVQLALFSLLEVAYFFALGRRSRRHQVIDAWRWNLHADQQLRAARGEVRLIRRVPDHRVTRLMSHRTSRVGRFLRPVVEDFVLRWSQVSSKAGRRELEQLRSHHERRPRQVTVWAVVIALVLVFGSRSLLVSRLPLLGQFATPPSPTRLIGEYLGGWQATGLQSPGPASPAFALLGVAGIVLLGAMGLLLKVELVLAVVIGAFGMARLVRPLGRASARLAASAAYLFLPLVWDDVARADLHALIAYAGAPFLLARLARATHLPPYGPARGPHWRLEEILGLSVLLALIGAFVPLVVPETLGVAVLLALGTALSGEVLAGLAALRTAAAGTLGAIVLLAPWSITYLQRGVTWSALLGAQSNPGRDAQLGAVFRLHLGPVGSGVLGLAFAAATLFPLLAAGSARFAWALRVYVVLLGAAALTWAASEGWLGPGGGAVRVLAAPLAVGIAAEIGIGVAVLTDEVARAHFGWRHLGAVAFTALCLAGLVPVLGECFNGRWTLPGTGYDGVLSYIDAPRAAPDADRTLWLGDPLAIPLSSWQISPGLAAAVSEGLPDGSAAWISPNPGAARGLMAATTAAESGATVRLGTLLAPLGVRYVVVPTALGPVISGAQSPSPAAPPQLLLDALTAQSDLHELPIEGGVLVFENTAALAVHPRLGPAAPLPAWLRTLGVVAELAVFVAVGAYYALRRRRHTLGRRARHGGSAPLQGNEAERSGPLPREAASLAPVGVGEEAR